MMTSIFMMNLLMTITFLMASHPLSMGMILLIQTTLVAMSTGMLTHNFWFSYILFMIMIGGMLVLFIYMTSVASNEKLLFSQTLFLTTMFLITTSMMLILITDKLFPFSILKSLDTNNMSMHKLNLMSMSKYFNYPLSTWMISMMMYLLLTLIAVVKITNITYGPLRQKM